MPSRLTRAFGFTPMAHRPPLPKRWWLYCAAAFLAPSLVLTFVSAEEVPYRDLVWLLTLVPAYLLALHYGMRGAVAGLAMGTVLFTAIQLLVAISLQPEDWRITVPIYTAYGALAISVGWLSQQLHYYYLHEIQNQRVATVSQIAVTIRHEVNNALATISAEAQLLAHGGQSGEDRTSLENIIAMTKRIGGSLDRLAQLSQAPVTSYVDGVAMIDLERLRARDDSRS
ncbi:MAG TPA: hypothetical protein VFK78_06740 [Gemmatimonadales bacterium]|nr:hypothetical protein [Gemmatimonadales bacterium]